ncbi:Alpha-amylase [Mycena indigotica]|uniref:alpha-amylase n=1 Tax=Mycena indigotica TaxID=2126181 RepID=A0A8H6SXT7_9AGAR|nr:Alpha-amylase [Mycena indigotica]KAF7306312.1 Alpha-amylase [Mycena indigotica]
MRTLLALVLVFTTHFYSSLAATASEWRNHSIYQLMTDRFARPDGSLTAPCDPNERVFCGGTWKGIISRLDYISRMGFTAIWVSPIVEQSDGRTGVGEAYHGYWTRNLYAFNLKFGTERDFIDLVGAAHERGMLVMLDVVLNHFANPGETIQYQNLIPFNHERYYHPKREIDWGSQPSIENGWMGNGYLWLPDLNTEDKEVADILVAWTKNVVSKYKIDGLRLDATRNIPMSFWKRICGEVGVYCQGEVWASDVNIVCPYQDSMDGLHNYPFKVAATEAFTSPNGNLSAFVQVAQHMRSQCKDVSLFGTFMENHDNPRLGSITTDPGRLRTLAVLNILSDGIPIVYYGQEQMLTGANDPLNREALWHTHYSTANNLVPTFTRLNAFRRLLISAASPTPFTYAVSTYHLLGTQVLNIRKGDVSLVLTNLGVATDIVVPMFAAGEELLEVLSCRLLRADSMGQIKLTLTGEPLVIYPRTRIADSETTICGA